MNHLELLKQELNRFVPLSDALWKELQPYWKYYEVGRKQQLTIVGETEKYAYLVIEGVQRIYAQHNNKDATLIFTYAPSFGGVLDSFLLQKPAIYGYETLTKSKFLRMYHHDFKEMMVKYPEFDHWVQVTTTQALSGTLVRYKELLLMGAEEKFKTLLQRSPQVLNLIPHKYLASYIGVDASTFSKLLGSVKL
ncbi:MAG: Crp/Fnr family transcriptional regulator [Flavipsychrobacter sp.]